MSRSRCSVFGLLVVCIAALVGCGDSADSVPTAPKPTLTMNPNEPNAPAGTPAQGGRVQTEGGPQAQAGD